MPGLDGLRGVAVLAVIVYHLEPTWLPGGFIGVDVFFVLSGFLISSLLLRERLATGRVDVARFFVRRVRRLLPAVLLLLLALSAYAAWWAEPVELDRLRRHGLATLGYVANWVFVADGTTYTDIVVGASPLRHVWSLAIEEQLYVVFALGIFVAAFGARDRLRERFGVAAGLLAVVSAVWMAWLSLGGASTARTYFGTDTRAHSMLVGAVLGAVLLGRPAASGAWLRVGGWVGFGVLAVVAVVGAEDALWLHRGGFLLVALAAAALVVAAASDQTMRRLLSWRPLAAVGAVSYGLYLWHWPVVVVFDQDRTGRDGLDLTVLRLGVSVVAAVLSYVLVEQPIRRGVLGRRWGAKVVVPAVASVAVVALALGVATAVPSGDERPAGDVASGPGAPVTSSAPEAAPSRDGSIGADDVLEAPEDGPIRVLMLGDSVLHTVIGGEVGSVGLEFSPWTPDQTTFDPNIVEIVALTKPACSFLPGELAILQANGSFDHASMEGFCGPWRSELRDVLGSVDVLALHLSNDLEDRWLDGALFEFGTSDYFELLGAFLDEIHAEAAGADVALVLVASAERTDPTWADPIGEREAAVEDFYQQWATSRSDVSVVDVSEFVCASGPCSGEQSGDEPWRWDGRHYTRPGALAVARWLTPALLGAAN